MQVVKLNAQFREVVGGKVKALRREGLIPAVLYGHGVEPKNIFVDYNPFQKVYQKAGESSLVDLKIDGKEPVKVLIQDVQKNSLSDRFIHIDFRQLKMTEKLETDIPLNFVGESKAVKEMSGILVKNTDTLAVKCLPTALVPQIDVDLSSLEDFESIIRASDIKIPEGMELMEDPETVVATVEEPRSEEELAKTEKPVEEDVESVKVEGEKREEAAEVEIPSSDGANLRPEKEALAEEK